MKKFLYLILFYSLCMSPAYARWANFDDAPLKISQYNEINIDADGRVDAVVEMEAVILKEQGRSYMTPYNLVYNGDNTEIKIIEAKTIYRGKEYNLDAKLLEDKPLASSANGFDQWRQILLAFTKAEIGAKIYLKYKSTDKRARIAGFYADLFSFGEDMFMDKGSVKLKSKLPLHIAINDPEKILKVVQDEPNNFHNLDVSLTRPMYKAVIGEPRENVLDKKYITYVSVSSLKKEESFGDKINAQGWDKVFSQALPQDFMRIANDASKAKNEADQINLVMSRLNDKVQYLGDWRSIEGKFVPHLLAQISKTQLGDCKDFAASTAAILNSLGYKARVALVRRGVGDYFYPNSLPDLGTFNHAIVKCINKQGKVLWLDPTNSVSMVGGIFPDIAGKVVLVLDTAGSSYERIPDVDPNHAQTISSSETRISKDGSIVETGQVTIKNEKALGLTGAGMYSTKKSIADNLFFLLVGEDLEDKNKLSMTLPDLKSRILKDISLSYSYRQENKLLKTNLGPALKQSYETIRSILNTPAYYVQDIWISSSPFSTKKQIIIKDVKAKNIASLNKEIKSPFIYVNRHCLIKNNDLYIDYELIVYKNRIPNEAIRSPDFLKLKSELNQNFKDVAIVFEEEERSGHK